MADINPKNPLFIAFVKNLNEQREKIREALSEFFSLDPQLRDVFLNEDDVIELTKRKFPIQDVPFVAPAPASTFEENALIASDVFERLFNEPMAPMSELEAREFEAEFEKRVGPSRDRSQSFIDSVVEKVLAKSRSVPQRESERPGMPTFSSVVRAAEVAAEEGDEADALLAKMLRSFSVGDRNSLRMAVRSMIGAAS